MEKVQPHSVLPRSRPTTAPGSSSCSNVGDDPSLDVSSWDDNVPNPASRGTDPPPSLGQQDWANVSSLWGRMTKEEGDVANTRLRKSTFRKATIGGVKRSATSGKEVAASLPLDSLCLCLEKFQSVHHIVTCASVCRHWRDAVLSDVVWKVLYLRWWHQDGEDKGALSTMSSPGVRVPPGFDTWRAAFISKYFTGKQKIRSELITHGVNERWFRVRLMPDRLGKQVSDCMPGDAMRKIVEELGLTFHVQINHDPPIRLRGKPSVVYFARSCLLRYPTKTTASGLSLRSLKSFKVTATSDRLLRTCTVASFTTLMGGPWEMVSREGQSPGPLRLLQQTPKHSMSLIVGTLFEGMHGIDGFSMEEHGDEQVLLVMASLHLSDIIWVTMELGEGPTPQFSRHIYWQHLEPSIGFYSWTASIQLHTVDKVLWWQEFDRAFWRFQESTRGQVDVFELIKSRELFSADLRLPWRTVAFSGELRGVFMLDFTLWDAKMEIAWQCTRAVRTYPAELGTVEYGPPGMDGERVHTGVQDEAGVSVSMSLCTPFPGGFRNYEGVTDESIVTDIRFSLTPKFLVSWFGSSDIVF